MNEVPLNGGWVSQRLPASRRDKAEGKGHNSERPPIESEVARGGDNAGNGETHSGNPSRPLHRIEEDHERNRDQTNDG
jgi:hypothetical protein